MLFNSITFLIFLPLVFISYWLINKTNNLKLQNLHLLTVSYVFYGWWDYRFLTLILASTLVDYVVGLKIFKCTSRVARKRLLPKHARRILFFGSQSEFKYDLPNNDLMLKLKAFYRPHNDNLTKLLGRSLPW